MSLDTSALGDLFELSRDAVVGIAGRSIVFSNPAAEMLLALRTGESAEKYIPDYILTEPADRFITAAVIGGVDLDVSVSRHETLTLLCFTRRSGSAPSPAWSRALGEMGNYLLTSRLAIDRIVQGTESEQDDRLRDYTAVLYQNYFRLKRLHSHMTLTGSLWSETTPFHPRLMALDALCGELCATIGVLVRSMEVGISFETAETDCYVMADTELMETMLLNLLTNSLIHSSPGDCVRMSLSRRGERIILAVDDPGAGIPPERLASLYGAGPAGGCEPLTPGAGLGFAIVRGIAELHGGAFILESREGQGTHMRISLPQPKSGDIQTFCQPEAAYRVDGMNAILTELSVVLDKSLYNQKSFD